jgi:hypothetical protein
MTLRSRRVKLVRRLARHLFPHPEFSVTAFDPHAYGPVFAPLLEIDRRRPLDAGHPDRAAFAALKQISIDDSFVHAAGGHSRYVADREMASCCLAGVWLLHDFLHESHNISQRIETPEGSYWHAIMHRREGDFSNAKYWYRRVGEHPVFETLAERTHVAASRRDANSSLGETRPRVWDPFAFVHMCQAVVRGEPGIRELCLDIQQLEWDALFDYCYHAAIGR